MEGASLPSSGGIVRAVLTRSNYEEWQTVMKNYLIAENLWDVIVARPSALPDAKTQKKNAKVLHIIQLTCASKIFYEIKHFETAVSAWNYLATRYSSSLLAEPDIELGLEDSLLPMTFVQIRRRSSIYWRNEYCIVEKVGKKALGIGNKDGEIPLFLSAATGHKEMTRYLYIITPPEVLDGQNRQSHRDRVLLLELCIKAELFDVASSILDRYPELPTESISYGFGALHKLAQMPSVFYSGSQFGLLEQIIYYLLRVEKNDESASTALLVSEGRHHTSFLGRWCSLVWHFLLFPVKLLGRLLVKIVHLFLQFLIILNILAIREIYIQKQTHYQVLHILRYMAQRVADFNVLQLRQTSMYDAMLNSARHGIVEFIDAMKVANRDLLSARDNNGRNIFSYAVLHRKPNVFQLIHTLNLKKNIMIESSRDCFGNNLLHQAGHLGQFSDINHRPGAALQMQREIQWFKAVEEIVHPKYKEERNEDNKKPHELFTETHEELVKAGEKWAKEAAASFTIVGTLITTIMFAAAFTVPGGSNQDTGVPIFLNENIFTTFVVADAISLFTSVTSVLIFIEVQTSRFAEIDFLKSLPLKILLGLFFLFVSVVSMMVVFCAALAIVLHKSRDSKHLFVGGAILGSVPVIVLIPSQLRLMYEIFRSTLSNPIDR